jgi:hypothetical protein
MNHIFKKEKITKINENKLITDFAKPAENETYLFT